MFSHCLQATNAYIKSYLQYPLSPCLQSPYIFEMVPQDVFPLNWLAQFLALRDASHFIVGASIQYAANSETRNMRLHTTSAASRNAILSVLDRVQIPGHLSKVDMITTFNNAFRIILWDTLDLSLVDGKDMRTDPTALEAIVSLHERLKGRQIIHRVSDREAASNLSSITRGIQLLDDPSGQIVSYQYPSLFALNCPECHIVGGSQLRSYGIAPSVCYFYSLNHSRHDGLPEKSLALAHSHFSLIPSEGGKLYFHLVLFAHFVRTVLQ